MDRRRYLEANCCFHPDRMASHLCDRCARTLCYDCAGPVERCAECRTRETVEPHVCARCGWLGLESVESCPRCGGEAVPRRPSDEEHWERRFRGYDRDAATWFGVLAGIGAYGVGIGASTRLALLGVPQVPSWWVFLAAMSAAAGLVAALVSAQWGRYELILSDSGIEVHRRGRGTDYVSWSEVMGLEFTPAPAPRRLVIHAPGREITVTAALRGWWDAVALIRRHAALVPPPLDRA